MSDPRRIPPGKRRRTDDDRVHLPCVEVTTPWWESVAKKAADQHKTRTDDPLDPLHTTAPWWSRTHSKVFGSTNEHSLPFVPEVNINSAPTPALPSHSGDFAPLLQFFTNQIQSTRNEVSHDLEVLKREMYDRISSGQPNVDPGSLNPSAHEDGASWQRRPRTTGRRYPRYRPKNPNVSLVKKAVRMHLKRLLKLPEDNSENFDGCISQIACLTDVEHAQYLRGEFTLTIEDFRIDLKKRGKVPKKFDYTAAFLFARDFANRVSSDAWYLDMGGVPAEFRTEEIIHNHFLCVLTYLKRLYKNRVTHPVSLEDNLKRLKNTALHSRQRKTLMDRRHIVYTETKYTKFKDAFDNLQAGDMSADETDTEDSGPTKRFVRAAPWWRSEKLRALCWDIDATDEQRKKSSVHERHRCNVGPRALERRHLHDAYTSTKAPKGLPFDWYRRSWFDSLSEEEKHRLCPQAPIMD